jgi:hypothetical protein
LYICLNMQAISTFLFRPNMSLTRYCLFAIPLSLIPSITLLALVWVVFTLLGVDPKFMAPPEREATVSTFFGAVIFAPIVETFLLAVGIQVIKSFSSNVVRIGLASAGVWGCLHALFGFMWFFGVVWSFFVWSCGYMAWQSVSKRHAFIAAAIPHAAVNALAMLALFLGQI